MTLGTHRNQIRPVADSLDDLNLRNYMILEHVMVATAIRDGFQQEQAATPAPQQQHLLPPNTPTEATLHWRALILLPDTNIPVPYDGEVQGHLNIIEAVFAFMNKPDQHDAKFVLPSELIGQN